MRNIVYNTDMKNKENKITKETGLGRHPLTKKGSNMNIAYKAGLEAGITDYQSEVRQGSSNLNPFKHGSDESLHFSMGYIDGFIK